METLRPLHTERLIIRCFEPRDWPGFLKFMTDPAATQYLLFTGETKTETGARKLFEDTMESYSTGNPVHAYALALKNNAFVGSCGFSDIDKDSGIYECYYCLLPEYWKRGYATEAIKALIDYCFRVCRIAEMRAYVCSENPGSLKVAERAGMRYLGAQTHPLSGADGLAYAIKAHESARQL